MKKTPLSFPGEAHQVSKKKERRGGEGGSCNSETLPDSALVICR